MALIKLVLLVLLLLFGVAQLYLASKSLIGRRLRELFFHSVLVLVAAAFACLEAVQTWTHQCIFIVLLLLAAMAGYLASRSQHWQVMCAYLWLFVLMLLPAAGLVDLHWTYRCFLASCYSEKRDWRACC